ncbi:hypothetical protein B0H21DRAFT_736905 [Amylocystis lapponica]|nr:hypothetical protein B0H21DRAFT_736905 [Amylocystis lapponica]
MRQALHALLRLLRVRRERNSPRTGSARSILGQCLRMPPCVLLCAHRSPISRRLPHQHEHPHLRPCRALPSKARRPMLHWTTSTWALEYMDPAGVQRTEEAGAQDVEQDAREEDDALNRSDERISRVRYSAPTPPRPNKRPSDDFEDDSENVRQATRRRL